MRRVLALLAFAAVLAGCGSSSDTTPSRPPDPAAKLLGGGKSAFEKRLHQLRGTPVVVNKWASWCGPCRAEFPFLDKEARARKGRVAFLGVNAQDVDADARKFLLQEPVPYPSFIDPDQQIARLFRGTVAFPSTAFYDSKGALVYLKQGGYASERKLAEDLDRYTR